LPVSATTLGRVSSAVVTGGRSARFVPSPLTRFDLVSWACSSALVNLGLCPLDGDVGVTSGSARDCFVLVFAILLVFFKAVEDMANRQINIFNLDLNGVVSKQRSIKTPMNIQPFTNSHSLYEQQTVSVDRATVFPQSTRPVVDDDKLTQLDELLRANVGDLDVPSTRKRRKHISSGKGQSTLQETLDPARKDNPPFLYDCVNWCITAFRLVSIANAPKIISLQPKPLPVRA
jgi:hypothetical protein